MKRKENKGKSKEEKAEGKEEKSKPKKDKGKAKEVTREESISESEDSTSENEDQEEVKCYRPFYSNRKSTIVGVDSRERAIRGLRLIVRFEYQGQFLDPLEYQVIEQEDRLRDERDFTEEISRKEFAKNCMEKIFSYEGGLKLGENGNIPGPSLPHPDNLKKVKQTIITRKNDKRFKRQDINAQLRRKDDGRKSNTPSSSHLYDTSMGETSTPTFPSSGQFSSSSTYVGGGNTFQQIPTTNLWYEIEENGKEDDTSMSCSFTTFNTNPCSIASQDEFSSNKTDNSFGNYPFWQSEQSNYHAQASSSAFTSITPYVFAPNGYNNRSDRGIPQVILQNRSEEQPLSNLTGFELVDSSFSRTPDPNNDNNHSTDGYQPAEILGQIEPEWRSNNINLAQQADFGIRINSIVGSLNSQLPVETQSSSNEMNQSTNNENQSYSISVMDVMNVLLFMSSMVEQQANRAAQR